MKDIVSRFLRKKKITDKSLFEDGEAVRRWRRGGTGNEGAGARADAENFQKSWCKFCWFTTAGCKDGDKCTFSHDVKDKPSFVK